MSEQESTTEQPFVEITVEPNGKRRYTLRGGPKEITEVETVTRKRMAAVGESISERQAIEAGLLKIPGGEDATE